MDSKEVSVIRIFLADFKLVVMVEMAGSVTNWIESTSSKEPKEALSKTVNLVKVKESEIVFKESAEKVLKEVALVMIKEPRISWTLAKAAEPKSPETTKSPAKVVQPEYLSKSAWALAVASDLMEQEDGTLAVELAV